MTTETERISVPDDLREHVRSQLPGNVRSLMDEIEAFAQTEIAVAPNETPISSTDPNLTAPALAAWHDRATIYLRDLEQIDPNGILHELLHLHRFWVEGIPQVMPKSNDDDDQWNVTSFIENSLEHMIIIPKEVEYGYDPYPYWSRTAFENWSRYPWPGMDNSFARRKNCLMGWLGSALVNDESVIQLMRECLETEAILDEAELFKAKINRVINRKPAAISCVFRFLNIPRTEAHLVYLDIRARQRRVAPIPRY